MLRTTEETKGKALSLVVASLENKGNKTATDFRVGQIPLLVSDTLMISGSVDLAIQRVIASEASLAIKERAVEALASSAVRPVSERERIALLQQENILFIRLQKILALPESQALTLLASQTLWEMAASHHGLDHIVEFYRYDLRLKPLLCEGLRCKAVRSTWFYQGQSRLTEAAIDSSKSLEVYELMLPEFKATAIEFGLHEIYMLLVSGQPDQQELAQLYANLMELLVHPYEA